jgi:alpha-L-fucosidase
MSEGDPHAQAQNTTMAGAANELVLEVPIQKPDVLVPVIELFLK